MNSTLSNAPVGAVVTISPSATAAALAALPVAACSRAAAISISCLKSSVQA